MAITIDIKRSKIYNEFSENERKEYFDLKYKKVIPCIDNIYYSIFIENDVNNNPVLYDFINELKIKKDIVMINHCDIPFFENLDLCYGSFNIYKFRLTNPDLYDVFILDYLLNSDTPRILIQLRSYGLWVYGYNKMIIDSYNTVLSMFQAYIPCISFSKVRENRIDYCYHTNCISNPYKTFSDKNIENTIHTIFNSFGFRGHFEKENELKLVKDYFSLGERSSNNIFVRIYNKALEVCELAYKSFFFEIWYQQGLINFYDKYCFEYAYEHKDFTFIHKARLLFYIEYGVDQQRKFELKKKINADLRPLEYKKIADDFMPVVTSVINVEFETKRKFYYYSDDLINNAFKNYDREAPVQLDRLFKILDNRVVFLDYLTNKTLSFKRENVYCDWWNRIRKVKHKDVFDMDINFVRDYSKQLDKCLVFKKAVNAISTSALYNNKFDIDFKADLADFISNVNDNTVFLENYARNKDKKYKRLKNLL